MRKFTFFSFLILLLVSACNKTPEYEKLSDHWPVFGEVYALKDVSPDSAMNLFQSVADTLDETTLSPFLYNEYQVLRVELLYKNHCHISKDSLMDSALRFYESVVDQSRHDDFLQFQHARSLYYMAVVESQRGQNMKSFSNYMRCLGIMDRLTGNRRVFRSLSKKNEYEHFTALTYTGLASFLYHYDVWDVALEMLEKANESYSAEGNVLGTADNLEMMGDIMIAQGNLSAAMRYYKSSDSIHETLHSDGICQNYCNLIHRSIELFNNGMNDSVYSMLHCALDYTDNAYITRKICYALAHFYYEDGVLDSALANYEKSYPLLPRQTIRSFCRIVQISSELGDSTKAVDYSVRLADFELEQQSMVNDKAKMITLYEQYKSDKRDAKKQDLIMFILVLVVILALVLVIDTVWLEKRRRRHLEDKEKHNRIKSQLENQLENALEEAVHKDKKISELEAELEKTVGSPDFQLQPFNKKMEVLKMMPICLRVCKVLDCNVKAGVAYPELALKEQHLCQLVNAVDSVFPKFSVRIIEQYSRLNRSDVIHCCLYILGINEIQAAALTGKTYQAVWKRSTKLHEIFGNSSDLMFFLHNLLKDWK